MGESAEASPLDIPFVDPIELLKRARTARIVEETQLLGGCCEPGRMYAVYAEDKECGKEKLFVCKDNSACCQHYFCCTNCREFDMEIICKRMRFDSAAKRYSIEWLPFTKLRRPCAYCCCSSLPEVTIDYTQNGKNVRLGAITNPCSCCNYEFEICEGNSEEPRYKVSGSSCQCGMQCSCSCSCCKEVVFGIYDCRKENMKIGSMLKVWKKPCNKELTNVNEHLIEFPSTISWQQKFLLLSCMFFIEFRYYKTMHR
eukprot:TRINITY_DN5355_c0_g1_i2.p1 TRINITY_DN5355_c0_g1~~TRINITY_DN5355_c0_g1_i2.p1  ORF type:complete len:256 (-),score=51.75 TRINITY_DN5355_c0_g1_i2:94-861(-)